MKDPQFLQNLFNGSRFSELNKLDYFIIAAVFGLILTVWLGVILVYTMRSLRRQHQLQRKLGIDTNDLREKRMLSVWHKGEAASVLVPRGTAPSSLLANLEQVRLDAGIKTPISSIISMIFGLIAGSGMLCLIFPRFWVIIACGLGVFLMGSFFYVKIRITNRLALFERQLVDALDLAARSLRSGHPLAGAFNLIATEIDEPVGVVFNHICQQHAMGMGLEEALRKVAMNTKSSDMQLFATAVAIQLKSGGNLAELMDSITRVMRGRMKLHRRVRVLTAQTQFSKRVLIALPAILFLVLNTLNPKYMSIFYTTNIGRLMMLAMVVIMILGILVMNRLAVIRY